MPLCEPCLFAGRTRNATRVYISPFAGRTHACQSCYTDQTGIIEAVTVSGGPYAGKVGSKGGGASADMAQKWEGKSGALRLKCLTLICKDGPHGADRLAFVLDEDPDNVSPRLSELVTDGYLEKGPRTAKTNKGNSAHVYQLTDFGRAWAAANVVTA